MAKKSVKARELRKKVMSMRYAPKVAQLKEMIRTGSDEQVFDAATQLNKLPRNASRSRFTRRCQSCGRPRAVYRRFGLCRLCLRKAAMRGDIPGLVKASW